MWSATLDQRFSSDFISTKTKGNLLQALLLSRILFNAGTWPLLTSAEHTRIHTAILRHTRSIARSEARRKAEDSDVATHLPVEPGPGCEKVGGGWGGGDKNWLSDQQVYQLTGTCAPFIDLVRLRILLWIRVLASAPMALRVALSAAAPAKRSWIAAVRENITWLANHTAEFEHWKGKPFEEVCADAAARPGRARAGINKVKANPAYSDKLLWATTKSHKAIDLRFPCICCGQVFGTKQGLAVHAYKAHGLIRDVRFKIDTHFCVACLQHFGSVERVVCHLREKSTRCLATYLVGMPDLSPEDCDQAQDAAAAEARACRAEGRKRHFASTPVIRLAGPLSPQAMLAGICHAKLLRDGKRGRSVGEVMDAICAASHC